MKSLGLFFTTAMVLLAGNSAQAKMNCTAYIQNKLTGFVSVQEQKEFQKYYSILKDGLNDRGFAVVSSPAVADVTALLSVSYGGEGGYSWIFADILMTDTKTKETFTAEGAVNHYMWTRESSAVKKAVKKIPVCLK